MCHKMKPRQTFLTIFYKIPGNLILFYEVHMNVCTRFYFYMIAYMYIWSSSSLCRAANTDFPNSLSLSPFISIIHRFRLVFQAPSCVRTVQLYMFELFVRLKHVHVKGSIGERSLWVRPYSSSSVPHVLFVQFVWFLKRVVGSRAVAVLWYVASRICLI